MPKNYTNAMSRIRDVRKELFKTDESNIADIVREF